MPGIASVVARLVSVTVSVVGLVVAVVGAVAGLSALGLHEGLDVISVDTAASLGIVSILCSLIAIPTGLIGWRWAEGRRENSVLGQAAALIGGTTFVAWIVVFAWALGQDP